MVPDIDLKLNAVTVSVRDIIRPAIDPKNAAANDQLKLVLGTIGICRSQLGYVHAYEVAETRHFSTLINEIAAVIEKNGGKGKVVDDAKKNATKTRQLSDDPMTFTVTVQQGNISLRDSVKSLIDYAAEMKGPIFEQVQKLILAKEDVHLNMERAWVASHGFDNPKEIPTLTDAITALGKR